LDENARETFATGRPLEDAPDLQQCKLCKKSILRTAATEHINACIKIKKEKAQRKKEAREARERAREAERKEELRKNGGGEDGAGAEGADDDSDDHDDGPAGKKPNAGKTTSKKVGGKKTDVGGKKRKAENDAEKAPKAKKKKDEPKAKGAKPKGPVDVERQCGVLLPNGQPCARSLTCKSHSMGAKRAVPGRSLPYDMLLAAYQKKNQAKLQSKSRYLSPSFLARGVYSY
jgi:SAGA-associated factor 73